MYFKTEVHESLSGLLKVETVWLHKNWWKKAPEAKSEIMPARLRASWKQEDRSSGDYDKTENFCWHGKRPPGAWVTPSSAVPIGQAIITVGATPGAAEEHPRHSVVLLINTGPTRQLSVSHCCHPTRAGCLQGKSPPLWMPMHTAPPEPVQE